jgi:hypothetical protein
LCRYSLDAKKIKAANKEGGKKGVEIEGAADMGGLEFFCTRIQAAEVGGAGYIWLYGLSSTLMTVISCNGCHQLVF